MTNQDDSNKENRIRIPSEKDLRGLPKYARFAFVGRCARRVLPLFGAKWFSPAALIQMRALGKAVEFLERSSCSQGAVSHSSAMEAVEAAGTAGVAAIMDGPDAHRSTLIEVASCIEGAARIVAGNEEHIMLIPWHAYMACHFATGGKVDDRNSRPIQADFDALRNGASEGAWTDTTLVPGDICGAFWPDGLPQDWPRGAIAASNAMDLAVRGAWSAVKSLAKGHPIGQIALLLDAVRRRMPQ